MVKHYLDLSAKTLDILISKPLGWELLLFAQVFKDGVDLLKSSKLDLGSDSPIIISNVQELTSWLSSRTDVFAGIIESIGRLINEELPMALGEQGTPGDETQIVHVAQNCALTYKKAIEWSGDCKRVKTNPNFMRLIALIPNISKNIIKQIEEYSDHIQKAINDAISRKASITLGLSLTIPESDLTELYDELHKLQHS